MRRVLHRHGFLLGSVIVSQLDIVGVAAFKAPHKMETDAPIRLHRNRPVASEVTLKRVQAEGWKASVGDGRAAQMPAGRLLVGVADVENTGFVPHAADDL